MSRVIEAIEGHARSQPKAVALSGAEAEIRYADLPAAIASTARAIEARLAGDQPVALVLDNGPAWALVDLALLSLGRPVLPLPPFFTPAQSAHALADAGAGALLRVAAPNEEGLDVGGIRLAVQRLPHAAVPLPEGTAKITYTSGSTGAPKGVCLSLAHMERTALAVVEALGAEQAGVHAPVLPLAILLENIAGLYASLIAGGRYHAERLTHLGFADPFRPDFTAMARAISRAGATSLILVPELLRGLMAAVAAGAEAPRELNFVAVGGARVSPGLILQARRLGLPAYEGYGLTECASVVTLNTPRHDRPGSVGRSLPGMVVQVAGDEIHVGPEAFLGYVGQAARTGPVATGDLGRIDADGFLMVEGRRSNVLITAFGRNVSPEWVESELLNEPQIAQAAVFGDGRADLCALVVPGSPAVTRADLDAAVARANDRLPGYARVARFAASTPFDPAAGELTGNGRPRREILWANRGHLIPTPEHA